MGRNGTHYCWTDCYENRKSSFVVMPVPLSPIAVLMLPEGPVLLADQVPHCSSWTCLRYYVDLCYVCLSEIMRPTPNEAWNLRVNENHLELKIVIYSIWSHQNAVSRCTEFGNHMIDSQNFWAVPSVIWELHWWALLTHWSANKGKDQLGSEVGWDFVGNALSWWYIVLFLELLWELFQDKDGLWRNPKGQRRC